MVRRGKPSTGAVTWHIKPTKTHVTLFLGIGLLVCPHTLQYICYTNQRGEEFLRAQELCWYTEPEPKPYANKCAAFPVCLPVPVCLLILPLQLSAFSETKSLTPLTPIPTPNGEIWVRSYGELPTVPFPPFTELLCTQSTSMKKRSIPSQSGQEHLTLPIPDSSRATSVRPQGHHTMQQLARHPNFLTAQTHHGDRKLLPSWELFLSGTTLPPYPLRSRCRLEKKVEQGGILIWGMAWRFARGCEGPGEEQGR